MNINDRQSKISLRTAIEVIGCKSKISFLTAISKFNIIFNSFDLLLSPGLYYDVHEHDIGK
jgi:hypothetical protein